mmetsp:Transcript_144764/g.403378  ORF Transcript_144764/g.403378 Transcript_144764/m.403378 type:complete len:461 (+) Transcript_144764:707-2089(+)
MHLFLKTPASASALKIPAKSCVVRATGRKTITLWSGFLACFLKTHIVAVICSSREVTRQDCGMLWVATCSSPTVSIIRCSPSPCLSATLDMELTFSGNVAEKSNVCRVSLEGSILSIWSICGRKPMSKSRSASSKTSTRRCSQRCAKPEFSRWSFRRPGVATRTAGGGDPLSRLFSVLMLVPPTTHWTPRLELWKVRSTRASFAVCWASSRVGASTSTPMWPFGGGLRTRLSIAGMRKPRVFPVPVFALAITSTPERQGWMVCACTLVIVVYLKTSAMARLVCGETSCRSSKRSPVMASIVVEEVRGAAFAGVVADRLLEALCSSTSCTPAVVPPGFSSGLAMTGACNRTRAPAPALALPLVPPRALRPRQAMAVRGAMAASELPPPARAAGSASRRRLQPGAALRNGTARAMWHCARGAPTLGNSSPDAGTNSTGALRETPTSMALASGNRSQRGAKMT